MLLCFIATHGPAFEDRLQFSAVMGAFLRLVERETEDHPARC